MIRPSSPRCFRLGVPEAHKAHELACDCCSNPDCREAYVSILSLNPGPASGSSPAEADHPTRRISICVSGRLTGDPRSKASYGAPTGLRTVFIIPACHPARHIS